MRVKQEHNFEGRVAVIFGASKGIGEATAQALARQRAKVMLVSRTKEKLERIVSGLNDDGFSSDFFVGDVSNYQDVNLAVDQVISKFGKIDFLINNAGTISPISYLSESNPVDWSHSVDVNLKGTYFGIRATSPNMKKNGFGVIINLSSGAASYPVEGWSHYCAAKAAVKMLTESAHLELSKSGISVISLSPGTVATDMQRSIRDSGINPISQLNWDDHIGTKWVGKAVAYLCGPAGRKFSGKEFSLRSSEAREILGIDFN